MPGLKISDTPVINTVTRRTDPFRTDRNGSLPSGNLFFHSCACPETIVRRGDNFGIFFSGNKPDSNNKAETGLSAIMRQKISRKLPGKHRLKLQTEERKQDKQEAERQPKKEGRLPCLS